MRATEVRKLARRLTAFVHEIFDGLLRAGGHRATAKYVQGLLLDGDRKSIEPMAKPLAADPRRRECPTPVPALHGG
jgi:SRSO17 transposase